jgi:methylthioribose-1-phosphate isomerase
VSVAVLDGGVRLVAEGVEILDRRGLPARSTWVLARTADEVAAALRDVVVPGISHVLAALAGLRLTARQNAGASAGRAVAALRLAGHALTGANPGDTAVRDAVALVARDVDDGEHGDGKAVAAVVDAAAARAVDEARSRSRAVASHAVALLPPRARVLVRPSTDTDLLQLARTATDRGCAYRWVVAESRPDLQGARLTAHALRELGQDVTLVGDGAVASVLHPRSGLGRVDALITAARRVTLDGHVVDGVGTLGAAIAARAFDVPFRVLVPAPDRTARSVADLVPDHPGDGDVLTVLGARTASLLVERGHHPTVDVVPPEWVDTVVTARGPLAPNELADFWTWSHLRPSGAGAGYARSPSPHDHRP